MNEFPHDSDIPSADDYSPDIPMDERETMNDPLVNLDIEMSVLGTLMARPDVFDRIDTILDVDHFAYEGHARVFGLCRTAAQEQGTIDTLSIQHELELSGALERFGGNEWFAGMVAAASGPVTATGQANIIRDLHYRRTLASMGRDLSSRAVNVEGDAKDLIEDAERQLSELAGDSVGEERSRQDVLTDVLYAIQERVNNPGKLLGHSTGLTQLDRILRGLRNTDVVIIAGRPSMGKTVLAATIAYNCARQHRRTNGAEGAPVLFFSLEMSADQLYERLIAATSDVTVDQMETGKYHEENNFNRVVNAGQELLNVPLFIDDRGGQTVASIRAHARRMKRKWAIGAVFIDYLQLINPPAGRSDGRVNEVSAMTKALKEMAKELDVPVVVLSQLSRQVEQRDPPIPRLSDLRDSGSIEQDADVVAFVYREEYYLERKEPTQRSDEDGAKFGSRLEQWQAQMTTARGCADILIEKNRKGKVGRARLGFQGGYQRFVNLDTTHTSNPQEDYGR